MPIRDTTSLSQSVERRRLGLGLRQAEVASAIGVSQGHYSKMVMGQVSVGPKAAKGMADWIQIMHSTTQIPPDAGAKFMSQARKLRTLLDLMIDDDNRASPRR